MSWQNTALCLFLRATRKRRYRTEADGEERLRSGTPGVAPPASLAERVTTEDLAGHPVDRVAGHGTPGTLVHLHGGAFVNGITAHHWRLVEHLSTTTGRDVLVPRYGLAPSYDVDDASALLTELGERLRADGTPYHLLGDSAGGNLALLLAQHLVATPGPAPVGVTLVAPWLDLSISNPEVDAVEPRDPWLTRPGLRPIARAWAAGHDLRDPDVSPLFGPLDTLPPTAVLVGSRDITWPDCRLLEQRAGGRVRLLLSPGSPHVHPLLPTPEGRRARDELVDHVEATFAS